MSRLTLLLDWMASCFLQGRWKLVTDSWTSWTREDQKGQLVICLKCEWPLPAPGAILSSLYGDVEMIVYIFKSNQLHSLVWINHFIHLQGIYPFIGDKHAPIDFSLGFPEANIPYTYFGG